MIGADGGPDGGPAGTRFELNGAPLTVDVAPETPLLYVLRNDLGLKGTRFGCGLGQCGACRVIVDGTAISSCDLPLSAVSGRSVTTVEGLGSSAVLDPLQQAVIDAGAGQCGYCLSGILISARALLDRDPQSDEDEIRAALEPNLCRCGIQDRVVRAVLRVAGDASVEERA